MLRFGLALMNDFPPGAVPADRVGELRDQAAAAAESGIDSIWVLQHYLGSMPTLQPLPLLSALTRVSGSMKLGTNMYILPLRHPVGVAEEFATLDHLSGGRAIAGFGMGYRENEFASFGVPLDERIGRFTESVQIVRALWSGEPVTFRGRHFSLDDAKISLTPVQPGGPPVFIGAGAHKAGIERAAALGDAWIVPPHVTDGRLQRAIRIYRDAAGDDSRARRFVIRRELVLDDDREVAARLGTQVRTRLSAEYAQYNAPDSTKDYAHLQGKDAAEEKAKGAYIFTDPEGAVEEFRRLEALGVTDVVLRMQWFDLPHEKVLHTLGLFRDHVLPALRG